MEFSLLTFLLPMDHPGTTPADADFLQRFIDSDFGQVSANILHTGGALLFTAGIGLYLYVAHLLRRSRQSSSPPTLGLLEYAYVSTLLGILANGAGGIMRLKQSGHPGLEHLGDEAWVQVLFIKHLFLLLGVGLAVYLTWRTRALVRSEATRPQLQREAPRMIGYALTSFLTIVLATVLGSVAANVEIRTGDHLAGPPLSHSENGLPPLVPPGVDRFTVDGFIQAGSAARPESYAYGFEVGADRIQLVANLAWATEVATLNLTLKDPDGRAPPAAYEKRPANWTVTVSWPHVKPGLWTLTVRGDQALNERFRVAALATSEGPTFLEVQRRVTVPGGEKFFEANLVMVGAKTLNFTWQVTTHVPVFFDIHVHHEATGKFDEPVAGEWHQLSGTYRHTFADTDEASLLWQNNGTDPVEISLRFWGHFTIHSLVPEDASTPRGDLNQRAEETPAQYDEGDVRLVEAQRQKPQ